MGTEKDFLGIKNGERCYHSTARMHHLKAWKMTNFTLEDIEHSRPLDVHRWSDFTAINNLINRMFVQYFQVYFHRTDAKARAKKHVKVLIIDLFVLTTEDVYKSIGLPMSPKSYQTGSRFRSLHVKSLMINIVDMAETAGLIEVWRGKEGMSRVSRIRPTKQLLSIFKKANLKKFQRQLAQTTKPLILLRSTDKKLSFQPHELPLSNEDNLQLSRSALILKEYNALLEKTFVDIPDLNSPRITTSREGKQTSYAVVTQSSKTVYRVFNDLSIESGGRFYGPFWQQLPKEIRARIYINDEPTVEIDYSGIHINLIYHCLNIDQKAPTGDPYEIQLPQLGINKPKLRRMAKQLMLIAINAQDLKTALQAFRAWLVTQKDLGENLPNLTNKTLKLIIDALRKKHKSIEQYFFTGLAKSLMTIDSLILEELIKVCTSRNIPILTVHDSVIVQLRYAEALDQLMKETYKLVTKKGDIKTDILPIKRGLGSIETGATKKRTKRYLKEQRLHNLLYNGQVT